MVKKFTIPFASQGDANDIPDALQVDGKVSFTQGFSYDYERPYDDPQAKDIAREDMNGIFKAITSAVGELQTLGASEWSSAIAYPKGAIVYFEKDLYISQADDNANTPPQQWTSIKNISDDSLKKAMNLSDLTNKTTARNNLGLGSSATLNKTDILGTSKSLVATQKLVNDTKINLENSINSKQDKLTFTGTGNVVRMSVINDAVPVGTTSFYIGETAPSDQWLIMQGQKYDTAKYPELFAMLKSDTLPDGRGVALRGLDSGRGFDPARTLLSYQQDAMQKITGTVNNGLLTNASAPSGSNAFEVLSGANDGTPNKTGPKKNIVFDSSRVTRTNTQNETVMKNLAFNIIIKVK